MTRTPPIDRQAFLHALDSLATMDRQVYILHRVEGRTIDAVAQRLGLTRDEVEALLVAALRTLHKILYGHRK